MRDIGDMRTKEKKCCNHFLKITEMGGSTQIAKAAVDSRKD